MKRYLGVDLHRTQFTVCTRLENGRTYFKPWPMRELKLFAAQLRKDDGNRSPPRSQPRDLTYRSGRRPQR